ncbi:MAG: peptidoglycan-binding protein [Patescibacteria group bacterium]
MSKLFKSKFLLGMMVVAVMFVGVFAVKANPVSAANCSTFTITLKYGMRNSQVMCLQQMLNEKGFHVDGVSAGSPGMETTYFGNATKAAVMSMQANLGLTADGVFGPMSRAALVARGNVSGNFPAGCASAAGFSMTTGMPCNGAGAVLPAGCATAAGFSVTTGQPCTSTTVVSGTNGYLADFAADSTNRVSTVYESETDKVVAGFRATARLSSQNVNRVRVTFVNAGTGSTNLGKYISSASLWMGSTKLATMSVNDADRATSSDTYTFNFSGLNAPIAKDTIGRFYVSVNANGSLDSSDATNANWTVAFTAGGISASSPDGSYDTYDSSAITQTGLLFGKFVSNGIKATVGISSSNPSAAIVSVGNTSATNGQTLLKFTVKATNTDLTLRKVPVQVTTVGANGSAIINTLKLYRGSDLVDSVDGSNGYTFTTGASTDTATTSGATNTAYKFVNLSSQTITAGSTVEFSVVADLKSKTAGSYSDGATIVASVVNADVLDAVDFSVQDQNGDQLTAGSSTLRVGSAIGNVMTLRENGVNTVMGSVVTSTTVASNGDITSVSYSIPLTITAFGNDAYIGQSTQEAVTSTGSGAVAFVFQNAASGSYGNDWTSTASHTIISDDATANALGTGFMLPSGTSKHFHVNVTLTGPLTLNTYYRVQLKTVQTFTDAGLGLGSAVNTLLPVDAFRTNAVYINN